ncbi:unnamed protein product, partial [marine sediment metagenome]
RLRVVEQKVQADCHYENYDRCCDADLEELESGANFLQRETADKTASGHDKKEPYIGHLSYGETGKKTIEYSHAYREALIICNGQNHRRCDSGSGGPRGLLGY